MKKEKSESILQKTKELLDIEDDLSAPELYTKLREYRNHLHPDKYTDENVKKDAEEKFKEAQSLLDELYNYIEAEKFKRSSKEIVSYKPTYDFVFMQRESDINLKTISELKDKLESSEKFIGTLQQELERKNDLEFKSEVEYLEKLYKPTTQKWASVGLVFLLSSTLISMTKIEEVSNFIKRYSPIGEFYINTILFFVFIFLFLITIKQYIDHKIVERKIGEITSSKYSNQFMTFLNDKKSWRYQSPKAFTENDVFEFLSPNPHKYQKYFKWLQLKLFNTATQERLKSIFISNLLSKKLIDISSADSLDRSFIIKENSNNPW
ncbi:MAG: hypothetical protein IH950_00490 [Bacteroidetes bacterium]|nr:hypothetical protein [Bacteroidota bacterium]